MTHMPPNPDELRLALRYSELTLTKHAEDVAYYAQRLSERRRRYADELRYNISTRAKLAAIHPQPVTEDPKP